MLVTRPTREKHKAELKLLQNLRMAALIAGHNVSESPRVQVRAAELLRHLHVNLPSPEFASAYMHHAGELADGIVIKVDHDMNAVTIKHVTADNVISLQKISVNTTKGGVQ